MIICFCEKINSFIKNNLKSFKENELQDIMPTLEDVKDQKCPYCKRKNSLVKYGHYGRHISFYHEHETQDFYVQIQKQICLKIVGININCFFNGKSFKVLLLHW